MTEIRGGYGHALLYKQRVEKKEIEEDSEYLVSIPDMYIFDMEEHLLFRNRSLKKCSIIIEENSTRGKIIVEDTQFNFDVLSVLFENKEIHKSDVEKLIYPENKIEFNAYKQFNCKIAIVADLRNVNGDSKKAKYIFYNCQINKKYVLEMTSDSISTNNIEIDFFADKNGKMFDIIY